MPSPMSSARSLGSARQGGVADERTTGTSKRPRSLAPAGSGKEHAEHDECSAFDLLHTERGFLAFEQWYQRTLAISLGATASNLPVDQLGMLWPQTFCPPNALHENAFAEMLRTFADCTDGEVFDFFDILDPECLGCLGYAQTYFAMCVVAAMSSRQLRKFLYFHSTRLFTILSRGCQLDALPGSVSWARLLMFLRLLGAPSHLISRVIIEHGVAQLAQITYEEFLEITYMVVAELDRGAECGEITVINEGDRMGDKMQKNTVRSRMCAIL